MKKIILILILILSIKLFSQTTVVDWSTVVNNTTSGTLSTTNTPNAVVTISGGGFNTLQGASPRWNTGGTNNWGMNGLGLAANFTSTTTTINLDINFTVPICNNLTFNIHDLNGSTSGVNGAFEDKITITTYDQNNNIITVNATNYVWSNSSFCSGQLYFGGAGGTGQRNIVIGRCQNGSSNGNDYGSLNSAVTVTISSPTGRIKRVVINYGCVGTTDVNRYYTGSDPGFQNIVISNFTARTAPVLNISTPVCNTNSTSVNLSSTASSTNSPTYAWTTTGGIINSGSNGLTPNVKGPGTFTLTAYNSVATCSASANITLTNISCNLLPVELTKFNAERINEHVILNWETATEVNNDYFAIEKSLNGYSFQTIDVVKGKGNTYQKIQYQTIDNKPESEITYYRLKQVDLNGQSYYSKIATVEAMDKEIDISQPVPNPFNDEFSISFQLKHKTEFITDIIDITGKKVRTDYDIFDSGTSHKYFHLRDYENGIYFLNIKSIDGSSNYNYKLIKN
jgi:hypothetical protein